MCPFPFKRLIPHFRKYQNATITWAQEEPKNAGGWLYVEPRLRNTLEYMERDIPDDTVTYAGRPIMAATATGYAKYHNESLAQLIKEALS